MSKFLPLAVITLALAGCSTTQPRWYPQQKQDMFAPSAMRIHPVFTQIRDWTGDGRADGLNVLIEFQDAFGDPAKASGNVAFEVHQYRPGYPDPRGARLVAPYVAAIDNVASQRDHWNRTSRCYSFQLAWPGVSPTGTYVLTANFELSDGGRFTDHIVIEPETRERVAPATAPAQAPGIGKLRP